MRQDALFNLDWDTNCWDITDMLQFVSTVTLDTICYRYVQRCISKDGHVQRALVQKCARKQKVKIEKHSLARGTE